ncbi:MAG: insulinase family protein [Bacilli bacterium]|nr:insulinase family protein [Bacilli bacterium]
MNYTNYNMGPFNLHVIKNDHFKTVQVKVNFKSKLAKDEITIRNMLRLILINGTKKYPSERLLNIESENLYDLGYSSVGIVSGNFSILSFELNFLNPKYTSDAKFDNYIDFLCEILFNPNIHGKKFNTESFNLVKEKLKNTLESEAENPRKYALNRLLEEIDKKANYSFKPDGYLSDLEKITEHDLYKAYEKMINRDIVDIFVIGDIQANDIKNIFNQKFLINTIKKPVDTHFIEHKKFRARTKTVKEKREISQSKLYIGFKCDKLSLFEKQYVANIYSFILGGGPDSKLFKSVREKNSLCYYVSSSFKSVSNLLIITSGIDKKDYRKAVNLIKKEVKSMMNGDFDDSDIKKAIVTYINSLEASLDSPASIISSYVSNEYLGFDLMDERIKKIETVTKDMIINFSKKIHLDTIFLLEGGDMGETEEI